ncbi:Arf guanine nucleotide exchange factor syt1 [Datura stramonium]|uniref:Arf guanine nucleotide exchange factor syt1 n=1 Tax=Datura stramonium TaxID=4076 RepID=A0ABS8VKA5_DATST|nr:Arf guanine nucleotide exchange factor syt1 [Datura stramonium]
MSLSLSVGFGGVRVNSGRFGRWVLSTLLGFCGFGVGVSCGLTIGYYLFIYFQPCDVKDPVIRPLVERDTKSFTLIAA